MTSMQVGYKHAFAFTECHAKKICQVLSDHYSDVRIEIECSNGEKERFLQRDEKARIALCGGSVIFILLMALKLFSMRCH